MISRSKLATSSRLVTSAWFGKEKFKIFFKIATISAIVFILTTKFCLNQVVLNFDSYDQSGVFMEGDEDIENIDLTAVENKKCLTVFHFIHQNLQIIMITKQKYFFEK